MYNIGSGSGNLGAKTGFVFLGSSILLLVLAWFYIPETRGFSTEVIDDLYERRFSPRKFGSVEREGEIFSRGAENVVLTSTIQKSEG